ncbi:hypothetical protein H5410_036194 [Solanum commersonii]|uniref:Uncharacterized protein n=1 Tax=Solanum commersonii TaxID=4109 RepID=A0A9J5Y4P7_SOLCO|nr:hypothetical protein H5410_036194 [Solanum commersonii]
MALVAITIAAIAITIQCRLAIVSGNDKGFCGHLDKSCIQYFWLENSLNLTLKVTNFNDQLVSQNK